MTPDPNEVAMLRFWLKENEDAVRFCLDVFSISQTLDDLVDRDAPVSGEEIERMAMLMFSDIPRNPFYRQHQDSLQSFMETALMYWMDANKLEARGEAGRRLAFVFRDIIGGLANKCALLIGGFDWWSLVTLDIHRRMTHDETYESYARDLPP